MFRHENSFINEADKKLKAVAHPNVHIVYGKVPTWFNPCEKRKWDDPHSNESNVLFS